MHWKPCVVGPDPVSFSFEDGQYTNEKPIAVWPARTTPRIMAQNGCFTVHGTSREPIEAIFNAAAGPHADRLIRFQVNDPDRADRELSDLALVASGCSRSCVTSQDACHGCTEVPSENALWRPFSQRACPALLNCRFWGQAGAQRLRRLACPQNLGQAFGLTTIQQA
jgi:hypothetical protein